MTSRREAGFTLVELLVVLAIVGMAVAVALPIFGHLAGTSVNTVAGQVKAALRVARSTAIAESRSVVFRGDAGGGYWLDRRHFALAAEGGAEPVRIATLGGAQISFYPSGGSTGGRILVTGGGAQREIAVDALTGRADAR